MNCHRGFGVVAFTCQGERVSAQFVWCCLGLQLFRLDVWLHGHLGRLYRIFYDPGIVGGIVARSTSHFDGRNLHARHNQPSASERARLSVRNVRQNQQWTLGHTKQYQRQECAPSGRLWRRKRREDKKQTWPIQPPGFEIFIVQNLADFHRSYFDPEKRQTMHVRM